MYARRSIFRRLVVRAVLLSIVMVTALWLVTHVTVSKMTTDAIERAVDVDLAGLADIYASGGEEELEARIEDRLALRSSDGSAAYYLLQSDLDGRQTGNLPAWPALDARLSEAGEIELPGGGTAWARGTQIAPDLRLLVARQSDGRAELLTQIALVFAIGGAILVAAVALLGRQAGLSLERRIDRINAAFRAPETVSSSLGEPPLKPDEIDELAWHSQAAIGRMQELVTMHREVSDQIAHEIRTPLMHLDNRLLRALKAAPEGECAERLVEARSDIKRLVSMLESLLDIASSRARRGDPHGLERLDLSELVERICDLFADSAEETGHDFSYSIAPGIFFEGEEMRLARLVTNLLDNAFKYVPRGGRIELTLEPGPVLTIADNGPGVPAEDREAVFERFQRADAQSGDAPGSGLGLTLARAIAERHGMTLELVDAAPGARFVMRKKG